jgi:hypothetical protein
MGRYTETARDGLHNLARSVLHREHEDYDYLSHEAS